MLTDGVPIQDRDPLADARVTRRSLAVVLRGLGATTGAIVAGQLVSGLTASAGAATEDVGAAQTAASLEHLAIAVYTQAAALPIMRELPPAAGATLASFIAGTINHHRQHAAAFNTIARKLGGAAQAGVNESVLAAVVQPALPSLRRPLDVVRLAAQIEDIAAQTYVAEVAAVSDRELRNAFASIMGVEGQHRAALLTMASLLAVDRPDFLTPRPPIDRVPAESGHAGFPNAFHPTELARPSNEGAVR